MFATGITPPLLFNIGPVVVTATVPYTLVASSILIVLALLARAGLERSGSWAVTAEFVVEHIESIMRDMFGRDPREFVPLVVTMALFVAVTNLQGLLPGLKSPTADFSTTAALALVVFLAVPLYGIRDKGIKGYLHHYVEPTILLLPLELLSEVSRIVALAIRLFGNMVSKQLVLVVLLAIAGLLVPVPLMMLGVLTSLVQAYIFAILTAVYLSSVVRAKESESGH